MKIGRPSLLPPHRHPQKPRQRLDLMEDRRCQARSEAFSPTAPAALQNLIQSVSVLALGGMNLAHVQGMTGVHTGVADHKAREVPGSVFGRGSEGLSQSISMPLPLREDLRNNPASKGR